MCQSCGCGNRFLLATGEGGRTVASVEAINDSMPTKSNGPETVALARNALAREHGSFMGDMLAISRFEDQTWFNPEN